LKLYLFIICNNKAYGSFRLVISVATFELINTTTITSGRPDHRVTAVQ